MTTASTGASFRFGARRAELPWVNKTSSPDSRAHAVHRDDGVDAGTKLRRVFVIHQLRTKHQQFAPAHGRVFLGGDHGAFNFGEEHKRDWQPATREPGRRRGCQPVRRTCDSPVKGSLLLRQDGLDVLMRTRDDMDGDEVAFDGLNGLGGGVGRGFDRGHVAERPAL